MFKSVCVAVSVAVASVVMMGVPHEAEAKRLAGGKPAGMQRQTPEPGAAPGAQPQQNGFAGQSAQRQAATPAPAAAPQAAPAKRSWLGPLAGLAAGLGIAALLSHFGLGDALASLMTGLLVFGLGAVAVVWLVRKLRGGAAATAPQPAPAMAWAGAGSSPATPAPAPQGAGSLFQSLQGGGGVDASSIAPAASHPDHAEFERLAKQIFIRLQAANDAADLEDLRKFTTPELFASLRLDLQERNGASQHTDVVQLNAQVVDQATQDGHPVVSVRFTGLIREERERAAEPFNEVWHLVGTAQGSSEWRIAGITPVQ